MRQLNGFNKSEKMTLLIAALCFALGLITFAMGREWTIAGIMLVMVHGILMLRVMMAQADRIEVLTNEKDEAVQRLHRDRLSEKMEYLKEDIEKSHGEIVLERQDD